MADAESKRFYLALAVWGVFFLLGLGLRWAGVLDAPLESLAVSFVLGLAAIFVFFRPPKA